MSQHVLSYFYGDKLLSALYANSSFTLPTTWFVALFTTEPMPDASGTEVSGGSYARQSITWGSLTSHQFQNSNTITWPTATANWGSIPWVAFFDASTAGNLISYAPASATITVNNGQTYPSFGAASLTVSYL